jgi:hypothetical protein
MKRAGLNARQAPELFRSIERARAASSRQGDALPQLAVQSGAPQALNLISYFAQTSPGIYSARALSSINGGTERSSIFLDILDPATGTDYGWKYDEQFADGTNFSLDLSANIAPELKSPTMTARALFSYTPRGSSQLVFQLFNLNDTLAASDGCMSKPNYCVRDTNGNCISGQYRTACTNKVDNTTPIKVCYNRGSQAECDYWRYVETGHPGTFSFPLAGSATFPAPVDPNLQGTVSIILQSPVNGGGCFLKFQDNTFLNQANWTASGNTLSWSFDPAAFPDPNGCLEFSGGKDTNLLMLVSLRLQGDKYGHFEFASDRGIVGAGDFTVPQIYIEQGCFAAGTQIRMADGSMKPVESFLADQKEIVRSEGGTGRTVLGTIRGDEPDPMVRLKTDSGHDLLVTKTHPVVTVNGVVMAIDLKAGDIVKTEEGQARLTSVTREPSTGKVYNLRLGDMKDAEAGTSTLYANGILTGDLRTQSLYEKREKEKLASDPAHVQKRLAPAWQEDYKNHLKRQKGNQG